MAHDLTIEDGKRAGDLLERRIETELSLVC